VTKLSHVLPFAVFKACKNAHATNGERELRYKLDKKIEKAYRKTTCNNVAIHFAIIPSTSQASSENPFKSNSFN